jgi:hypothetical protein
MNELQIYSIAKLQRIKLARADFFTFASGVIKECFQTEAVMSQRWILSATYELERILNGEAVIIEDDIEWVVGNNFNILYKLFKKLANNPFDVIVLNSNCGNNYDSNTFLSIAFISLKIYMCILIRLFVSVFCFNKRGSCSNSTIVILTKYFGPEPTIDSDLEDKWWQAIR